MRQKFHLGGLSITAEFYAGWIYQQSAKIYEAGENRALRDFSNRGAGKQYASAFAMRELGFQRVLFLVHRNQIAKQAMKSYRKVFGGQVVDGTGYGKTSEI